MCTPAAPFAIAAGLQVAQGALNFTQKDRAVRAQNAFNRDRFETTKELAEESAQRQLGAIRLRARETSEAAALEIQQVTEDALRAAGLARVSAAASGAAGASVAALIGDFAADEIRFRDTVTRRQAFEDLQFESEADAIRLNLRGRLLSAQPIPLARPSPLNALLGIGAGVFGAFQQNTFTNDQGNLKFTEFP